MKCFRPCCFSAHHRQLDLFHLCPETARKLSEPSEYRGLPGWMLMRVVLLALGLFCVLGQAARAQPFGPTNTVPITKLAVPYNDPSEAGGGCCGIYIYAELPVYRSYTNRSSYTIYTPGTVCDLTIPTSAPVGGSFRFYCTFQGCCGPGETCLGNCQTELNDPGPPWYAEVGRSGPVASFTNRVVPPFPGDIEFTSTSTDPDLEPIALETWTFGDGADGLGVSPIHRYTRPGSFTVGLTVTDSDGLTNRTTRTVVVPAPRLTNSLRIISQYSGARIAPNEVFEVRATVSATADGVGDLSNVAFAGPPLEIPTNGFTVVEAPSDTSIGILNPGEQRTYTWRLRAGSYGDFVLRTARTTGQDATNRAVSGQPAVALGNVSALVLGIEQYPTRIVLGEDVNDDGTVNNDDALVKLVISITNVSEVDVTDVRTDNLNVPLDFTSRLDDVQAALEPVGTLSGNFGTIKPGAANAVIRTNVYLATDYVFATVSALVRGNANGTPIQAGGQGLVKVEFPGVDITMHKFNRIGLTFDSVEAGKQSVNAPLVPVTVESLLDAQQEIPLGLIGDGVTPLLFILKGDTKALAIQNSDLNIRLVAKVLPSGRLLGDELQKRLRILKEGAWVASDSAVMTQDDPVVYAYLLPIPSDDIQPAAGNGLLRASLVVQNTDSEVDIEEFEFGLRKPPLVLLHDYNTNGEWGRESEEIFKASRPLDPDSGLPFLKIIRYGQSVEGGDLFDRSANAIINTTWPLEELAPLVFVQLRNEIEPLKEFWAFTRYDVVAHGQGGLLARMLSSVNQNGIIDPFRNEENFYRGRFHRVVTIGSPHNGSRLLRYISRLVDGQRLLGALLPQALVSGWLAGDKFDPWGAEIANLNNTAKWTPDPGANFHLVRTAVNDGQAPSLTHATFAETALGLRTLGQTVIPRGSDGVVDFDSMGAASPGVDLPNVYTVPNGLNISHATTPVTGIADIFGGNDGGQVTSTLVAQHAIGALDGAGVPDQHRVFGPIRPPTRLLSRIRDEIDAAAGAVKTNELGGIVPLDPAFGLKAIKADGGPRIYNLKLTPSPNRPTGSQGVYWTAELFGTNGVSTNGLTLTPDSADSTRVSVRVSDDAVGDVVVYAFYVASNGETVYSQPQRVASFEPSSPPVELRVMPQGVSIPAGKTVPIEVFVRHENGLWLQRHVAPGEISATSRDPLIVNVLDPLRWRCLSAGRATVSVAWRGLTNTAEVTVFGFREGVLPIPDPLVWLRADAGLTLTNGTNVISWTDQSRNNFVFTPPTAATRPFWMPGTNGRPPTVRFTGSASPHIIGNLGRTLTNTTIFTLGRFLDTGGGTRYIYSFGTRNFSGLQMTLARQNSDGAFHFDGAASWLADNAIPGTNFIVFSQVFGEKSPDQHRLMVNAKTVLATRTTVGRAYSAIATNLYIGRYPTLGGFGGDLVEWLVYDRVLSVEERFEVEEYLRQRVGLAPFVPAGSLDLAASETVDFAATPPASTPWSVDLANRSMIVRSNDAPSFSLAELAASNQIVRTRITPTASTGSVGVVFGYLNPGTFHLFDWRQTNGVHAQWGTARAGMRWRSFHIPGGESPNGADFWSGSDPSRLTILHSNNIPWVPGRTYDFILSLRTNETAIEVNFGTTNLARWTVPGALAGRFGHYAQNVTNATFGPVLLPGASLFITGLEPASEGQWTLRWANGQPPFTVEESSTLSGDDWNEVTSGTVNNSAKLFPTGNSSFFRVRGTGVAP